MSRIRAHRDAQQTRAALHLLTLTLIGQQESYGYELVERLSSLGLDVGTGLIYPVLNRLERDQLVITRTVASDSGPPRKYFSLTPAGEHARDEAEQQWRQICSAVEQAITPKGRQP